MAYKQLPGQADSPKRETPVPEHYAGVNFPYRGTQTHGVEPPQGAEYDTREFQYKEDDESVHYVHEDEPKPPIDVRIVNSSARERLEWRAVRVPVSDGGGQVVGRHDKRRNLIIKNQKTTATFPYASIVYIGSDSGVSTYTGFALQGGESIELRTTGDVWAICDPGNSSELSVAYEIAVDL